MRRFVLLALVLAASTLACNLLGSDEPDPGQPADSDSSQPSESDSGQPDEQSAQDPESGQSSAGGPQFLDLDDPLTYTEPQELVNSYRIALSFAFEGTGADGTPVQGTVTADGERILEPLAMSMTFDGMDTASLSGELPFSFSLIDNTYHFSAPLFGCASIPAGQFEDPFSQLIDMGGFLSGSATRMRPDDVIDGIPVYGFSLDASNIEPGETEIAKFDSGAVYIAQDGGYLVRLEMSGRGTSEMLSGSPDAEGEITYDLNYFDFNQTFDIAPPEGCNAAASESEYPVTADAYQLSQALGITSFKSDLPFEEVIQFYKDEMAADGWALDEEFVSGPIALLSFTSDTGTVQITISFDEGTGTVDVGIIGLG
jgi:hypothetical protein